MGYRAQLQGNKLVLALGYSHPVEIEAPDGHRVRGARCPPASSCAASPSRWWARWRRNIRKQRPPEPYKGKGIRYEGEYVARKVGKRA